MASKIALSLFLLATANAAAGLGLGGGGGGGGGGASQYRIADGSHDEKDKQPTSALVDLGPEASADAGKDTVDRQRSLRGLNGVGTSPNVSTGIGPAIDAGGTAPTAKIERSIRRVRSSARVSRLPEQKRDRSDTYKLVFRRMLDSMPREEQEEMTRTSSK